MGMDTFLLQQAQREREIQEHDRQQARIVVAGAARDTEDARELLDALGLIDRREE